MKALRFVLPVWILIFAGAAPAQQATLRDPLLDRLTGHWVLDGALAGKRAVHDVTAEWVLNHQYVEFHEVSRDKNRNGDPAYIATVYIGWYEHDKDYVCVWLDDYGGMSTQSLGRAPRNGNMIAFVFQDTADAGKFRTTFAYDAARDGWTMNMDQDMGGKLSPFARMTMTRAK